MGKDLQGKELGMGLSQRKDGRYQARFTKSNEKRAEKNFKKLTEARSWLEEQKYLDRVFETGDDMLVDDWYNFWIENYKEGIVAYNTTKNYKSRYHANIKPAIGKMKLSDVRQSHCQKILNTMFDSGKYAQGTIELTQITMHALFDGAVENRYIVTNPASKLKLKTRSPEQEERRVLSRDEQRIFKQYSQHALYYNAYCLVLETGLRVGEIGGLQWSDINFEDKTMYVQRTILQKKGGFYFGVTKSKLSTRIIPLTNEAINILHEQQILQKKLQLRSTCWQHQWDGLVFTTINGNPVGGSTFRNMMARIIRNINIDRELENPDNFVEFKDCTMHSLRHTFATRCIENGVNPKTLQKILGHSTIQVTMDLYVHVVDDYMFSEIEKMNVSI